MSDLKRAKTSERGFTLVELMVVIAIIGAMVGLLVGGIGPAISMAQNIECQNNLKQIAASVINYATDYKGTIPPTKYAGTSGLYWCNFLVRGGYLTADDSSKLLDDVPSARNNVLRCPAENALILTSDNVGIDLPAIFSGSTDDKAQGIARLGSATFKVDCSYYWNGYAGNASGEPDPSTNSPTARFPSCIVNPSATADKKAQTLHDISEIRQRTATAMVMDGVLFDGNARANRGRIAARHRGDGGDHCTTNMAFYDGHVEAITRAPGDDHQYTHDIIQSPTTLLDIAGFPLFTLPQR
ncbi:MAG: type II secretion system protein [Planctomycetota bacterium]|nr:type II secretion system protein [Planctomycetota bacterium]